LQWLEKFSWLSYSKILERLDGAFCKYCILFGHLHGKNAGKLEKLKSSPIILWTSATCKMKEHEETSVVAAQNFDSIMKGRMCNVKQQIHSALAERVSENRRKYCNQSFALSFFVVARTFHYEADTW